MQQNKLKQPSGGPLVTTKLTCVYMYTVYISRINGVPACANQWLLKDLLRDEWGFNGYVVSDEGAIEWMLLIHRYKSYSTLHTVLWKPQESTS